MLGLLGLVGAVVAGAAADAILATRDTPVTDPDMADDAPPEEEATRITPLHRMFEDDGMPVSSDIPATPDDPVRIVGGAGHDLITGGGGNDTLIGGEGNDQMIGGRGNDQMDGGDGNDTLFGGRDRDVDFLNGGAGDDVLHLGPGDYGHGGDGADTFVLGEGLPGDPAVLCDFNAEDDFIELRYDTTDDPPVIEVVTDENGQTVLVNGRPMAVLPGGTDLTVDMIRVMPMHA